MEISTNALDTLETLKQHVEEIKPTSLADTLKASLLDPTEPIEQIEKAWVMKLPDSEDEATLGTIGNFSLVIGKAKSRKSFLMGIAVSAASSDLLILDRIKGTLPPEKNMVLYFDTEQGKQHAQMALRRICRQISNPNPSNLKFYYLRKYAPAERLKMIEYAIENTPNVGLVVIDGIKDLITSINDEEQATMIASKLLKWTEEKQLHLISVLHQNKSDTNARGHIGTELVNKAETVLSVTKDDKDKDISIVEPDYCRDKDPETFAFEIVNGLPQLVPDFEQRKEVKKSNACPTKLPDYKLFSCWIEVFTHGKEYSYKALVEQIRLAFDKMIGKPLAITKAKTLITYSRNQKWVIQDGGKRDKYKLGQFQKDVEDGEEEAPF